MKRYGGMFYPDDEQAMIDWCKLHGERVKRPFPLPDDPPEGVLLYQAKKQRAVLEVCCKLEHMRTAVDVGAHIGMWSVNLSMYFWAVEAFEPVEKHRECWEANMAFTAKDHLHPYALGDRAGTVRITSEPGNSGNSFVAPGPHNAEMRTLDSFQFRAVDLIKIDCEGFEANVVAGARETIEANRPVMIVEQKRDMGAKFGHKPQAAIKLLFKHGYVVYNELGGDFICVHESVRGKL